MWPVRAPHLAEDTTGGPCCHSQHLSQRHQRTPRYPLRVVRNYGPIGRESANAHLADLANRPILRRASLVPWTALRPWVPLVLLAALARAVRYRRGGPRAVHRDSSSCLWLLPPAESQPHHSASDGANEGERNQDQDHLPLVSAVCRAVGFFLLQQDTARSSLRYRFQIVAGASAPSLPEIR